MIILFILINCFISESYAQLTQYFTLVNKTGITIHKIFVAPVTDSENWSQNILPNESLGIDEKITLNFNKSNFPEDCVWDIKIQDNKEISASWYDIDLCRFSTIILHWNEKKDESWVEFE